MQKIVSSECGQNCSVCHSNQFFFFVKFEAQCVLIIVIKERVCLCIQIILNGLLFCYMLPVAAIG